MARTDPNTKSLSWELFGVKYQDLTREQLTVYRAEWSRRNPDKVQAHRKRGRPRRLARYREKYSDPAKLAVKRAYDKKWRQEHPQSLPGYYRKYRLKREYGISPEQYEAMRVAQGGKCAICERTHSQVQHNVKHGLHVDHDHATGKVRGLLCHHCNMVLGHLDDNIERMKTAIRYLEFHRGQHGSVVSTDSEVVSGVRGGVGVMAAQGS